jgi:hypothetical protein
LLAQRGNGRATGHQEVLASIGGTWASWGTLGRGGAEVVYRARAGGVARTHGGDEPIVLVTGRGEGQKTPHHEERQALPERQQGLVLQLEH